MKNGIQPLVIGNWKMNPLTATLSKKLAGDLKKGLAKVTGVDVVIAPPMLYVTSVHHTRSGSKAYALGVQNIHHEKLGAHTGEISLSMVKQYDVTHVILGHSERRKEGETDAQVHEKLLATLKSNMTGVVCVGEEKRDTHGHYLTHIETQIRSALATIPKGKLGQIVIAYEPIWAIGTGTAATAADVHEIKLFIEKVITDLYGRNYAQKVRIIYGGSVNPKNVRELFTEGMMDGFLVGGASLHAEDFIAIIKATQTT